MSAVERRRRIARTAGILPLGIALALGSQNACGTDRPSSAAPPAVEALTTAPQPGTRESAAHAARASEAARPAAAEPAAANVAEACGAICARAERIGCGPSSACTHGCFEMSSAPGCTAEMRGFLSCAAAEPEPSWECDPGGGVPTLRDGHCDAAQLAVIRCFERSRP